MNCLVSVLHIANILRVKRFQSSTVYVVFQWFLPLWTRGKHPLYTCLLLKCGCVSAWNEYEYGYSYNFSHLLALDSFALFITLPTVRLTDSCASLTCALPPSLTHTCSLFLPHTPPLSLSLFLDVPAFCLFKKHARSACILCVICSLQRAAGKDIEKNVCKTRNLFSFYANQITHTHTHRQATVFYCHLWRRCFWRFLLSAFSSVFNLNSVWQNKFAGHKCVLSVGCCQQFVRGF